MHWRRHGVQGACRCTRRRAACGRATPQPLPLPAPAGVALFADSSRAGLALFGPGTKPGSAAGGAPAGWHGVFTGDFPVGQTLCFVEGYYALPFILEVSRSLWQLHEGRAFGWDKGHGSKRRAADPSCAPHAPALSAVRQLVCKVSATALDLPLRRTTTST